MFRFKRKPSSGSHSQYLAKVTHLVQCGYIDVVQTLSHSTRLHCAQHTLCSRNTDSVRTTSMNPH